MSLTGFPTNPAQSGRLGSLVGEFVVSSVDGSSVGGLASPVGGLASVVGRLLTGGLIGCAAGLLPPPPARPAISAVMIKAMAPMPIQAGRRWYHRFRAGWAAAVARR
jgi:hypothetical protein